MLSANNIQGRGEKTFCMEICLPITLSWEQTECERRVSKIPFKEFIRLLSLSVLLWHRGRSAHLIGFWQQSSAQEEEGETDIHFLNFVNIIVDSLKILPDSGVWFPSHSRVNSSSAERSLIEWGVLRVCKLVGLGQGMCIMPWCKILKCVRGAGLERAGSRAQQRLQGKCGRLPRAHLQTMPVIFSLKGNALGAQTGGAEVKKKVQVWSQNVHADANQTHLWRIPSRTQPRDWLRKLRRIRNFVHLQLS